MGMEIFMEGESADGQEKGVSLKLSRALTHWA